MAKLSKSGRIIKLYLEGKQYSEIMKAVGVTHGRVSSTLNRARTSGRIPPNFRKRPGPNNQKKKVKERIRWRKRTPAAQALALLAKRKCSRCQKIKRMGSRSWIRDRTKGDGWYPICKVCMREVNAVNYKKAKRKVLTGE